MKSDKIFDVDASYQGDKVKVIEIEAAFEMHRLRWRFQRLILPERKNCQVQNFP